MYLRVFCSVCGAEWDYYDETYEPPPRQTAVQYQGCICPKCGCIGIIFGGVQGEVTIGDIYDRCADGRIVNEKGELIKS